MMKATLLIRKIVYVEESWWNMLKKGDKVGIVCCSNGIDLENKPMIDKLQDRLRDMELVPVMSDYVFARNGVFSGTAEERGTALMDMYRNDDIKAIFDISGGDIANEVLPYLDFDVIKKCDKKYWGYSDNSTIVNALYTKLQRTSILYQMKNLVHEHGTLQCYRFIADCMEQGNGENGLFDVKFKMLQGDSLEGILIGGNLRCFLKLAGTEYFPDLTGKVLLLEGWSGGEPQLTTFFAHLKQLGAFNKVNGVMLGTFTQLDKEAGSDMAVEILRRFTGTDLPIAKTRDIGHGHDAKAIVIGKYISIGDCEAGNDQ